MKIIKVILAVLTIVSMIGCTTTEKFTVYAPEGTKVYTPDYTYTPKGEANYSGRVDIEIPSDMYCGYVLVESSESDVKIPIGIDYKINKHTGTKAALYTAGTISCIGLGATLIGGIACIAATANGDDDVSSEFGIVTGIGAAVAGIGSGIGITAQSRLRQTAFDYNFGYNKYQQVSIPNLSSSLINPNLPKTPINKPTNSKETPSRKKASSGKDVVKETTSGSTVSATRSDFARKIEGKYNGYGSLLKGTAIDEKYEKISVILERIDKNHVKARIIESDEDYFDAPLIYEIKKGKNGVFMLKIENLPEATIQIKANGKMSFLHKKVNIENTIYTLKIEANKE